MSRTDTSPSPAALSLQHEAQLPRIVSQGRYPTRAYGVLLDRECMYRLGTQLYEEAYPGKLSKMSPKEARKAVFVIRSATLAEIPDMVYDAFPNLPQLPHSLVLLSDVNDRWLFIFKDNSSRSCSHAYVDPEDVKGAKKLLGVPGQVAQWHRVSVYD